MKRIMLSIIACLMLLIMCAGLSYPALAAGSAPVAENLELNTYRNTSVSGMLSAYDPEEDVVSFEITTSPVKGDIELEQNGSFIYTPREGKKGRDYFGYKAIDSEGNISQEATVIIRIEKQKKSIDYKDMENRAGEYAAVTLNKAGILTGEKLGGSYYFYPDKPVSSGEFMEMCKLVSGKSDLDSTEQNGEALTKKDAIMMLNDVLELNNVSYLNMYLDEDEPAVQACMNLSAVGVLKEEPIMEDILTREAAALMLVQAMEIIENR